MDEPGAVEEDRPDVERRVAKQDRQRGDVAAVEIEVDDDRAGGVEALADGAAPMGRGGRRR